MTFTLQPARAPTDAPGRRLHLQHAAPQEPCANKAALPQVQGSQFPGQPSLVVGACLLTFGAARRVLALRRPHNAGPAAPGTCS